MTPGIIIQARIGSTRFRGKVLKDFYEGDSILKIQIDKLSKLSVPLIIATGNASDDDPIEDFARRQHIECFRGDENDVLKRYIDCAGFYGFSHIVRVCADNPFLSRDGVEQLLSEMQQCSDTDYIAFSIAGTPSILTHFGFWAEGVPLKTLHQVAELTQENMYREHVTNYIYNNPDTFSLRLIELDSFWQHKQHLRFTVDTADDFFNMAYLYRIVNGNHNPEYLVNFVENMPELIEAMKTQIKQNSK